MTTVSRLQYFEAVAQLGDMELLYQAVSADPYSSNWIQFNSAACISDTDSIATLTQTTFGWSSTQMANLFTLAASLPGACTICTGT